MTYFLDFGLNIIYRREIHSFKGKEKKDLEN